MDLFVLVLTLVLFLLEVLGIINISWWVLVPALVWVLLNLVFFLVYLVTK